MSPELRLVLAAAATVPSEAAVASLEALASDRLNWDEVLELAVVHRVRPALLQNLRALLPAHQLAQLERECAAISAHNRFLAAELCSVVETLASHGIRVITFKGPVLAQQICGDVSLAEFSDLDLLVPREMVWPAVETLEGQGYRCEYTISGWHRQTLLDLECEVTLVHPAGHTVDLHWDFTASYYRPFPITVPAEPAMVQFLGSVVAALSREDATLFAIGHLSRHGSWIAKETAQIASILRSFPALRWDRIVERASQQGCRRMALFAVAAAARFHQAPLAAVLVERLRHESQWLDIALARSERWLDGLRTGPPGALPRLGMRLSHLDSIGQRAGHAARFMLTPRPATCTRFPLAGRLAQIVLRRRDSLSRLRL